MKRIAFFLLVGGALVASSMVAAQVLADRTSRAEACDALLAASESGAAFIRTVVGDDIDFRSDQAISFEADLDAAYEAAGRSGDQALFRDVIHGRGEFFAPRRSLYTDHLRRDSR